MKIGKKPVIADTNILFSALLKTRSKFAEILLAAENDFFVCESVPVELFKYKEKIVKASALSEDGIIQLYHIYLKRIHLFKEELIRFEIRQQAYQLCNDIDENDISHVALTLELNGLLWTGDIILKEGLLKRGFTHFFDY